MCHFRANVGKGNSFTTRSDRFGIDEFIYPAFPVFTAHDFESTFFFLSRRGFKGVSNPAIIFKRDGRACHAFANRFDSRTPKIIRIRFRAKASSQTVNNQINFTFEVGFYRFNNLNAGFFREGITYDINSCALFAFRFFFKVDVVVPTSTAKGFLVGTTFE